MSQNVRVELISFHFWLGCRVHFCSPFGCEDFYATEETSSFLPWQVKYESKTTEATYSASFLCAQELVVSLLETLLVILEELLKSPFLHVLSTGNLWYLQSYPTLPTTQALHCTSEHVYSTLIVTFFLKKMQFMCMHFPVYMCVPEIFF